MTMTLIPHIWSDKNKTSYHDNGQNAFQTCEDNCPYCGERILWKRECDVWEEVVQGIWQPIWEKAYGWLSECEHCDIEFSDPYQDGAVRVFVKEQAK